MSLGTANLTANFDGKAYQLNLQARLTGLAGLVVGGGGSATSTGQVGARQPLPLSYAVTSSSGRASRTVRIGLNAGNVTGLDIAPPLEPREDRVPVQDSHKRGIVDPVGALVMPITGNAASDPANCNRTLPVFDGAARFDIRLTYEGTHQVEKPGYAGPVLVCRARYVPISGHRAERSSVKFMEDNRDISVWLAPVEGAKILVPLRIAVQTQIGMSVVEASRWRDESNDIRVARPSLRGTN